MERNFLTSKELVAFKSWIAENGFTWEEDTNTVNVFDVADGRFNLYVATTSDPELFEVIDDSERGTAAELLEAFYKNRIFLYGVEASKKIIEKFVPEEIREHLHHFDHFRIYQRPDKLWDLLGSVGYYVERLAICNYKLPLKVLGSNFQEAYWTLIYTSKKEKKVAYADDQKHNGHS